MLMIRAIAFGSLAFAFATASTHADWTDAAFPVKSHDFGTVAVGQRANLVLLTGNPLEDIGNTSRRAGVMVRGRWFSEDELQAGLADIEAVYRR